MTTCTRRIQFCAGHRVAGHENKCRNLHGHNYVAWIEAERLADLDPIGRVIDFSVLKEKVGGWIDRNWDHGFILWGRDVEAINAVIRVEGQKLYYLPFNPTAENMSAYLLAVAGELLAPFGIRVVRVSIDETENCSAEVTA